MRRTTQVSATFALFGLLAACSAESTPTSWGDEPADPGQQPSGVVPPGQTAAPGVTPGTPVTPGTGGTTVSPGTDPAPVPEPVIPTGDPIPLKLDGTPSGGQLVRLTHLQWANTVKQLLALTTAPEAAQAFAPDAIVGNFSNNEKYLTTSQTLVSDYERAVEDLVEALTDQQLAKIYTGTDADGFIKTFGRRAYRRPLSAEEVTKYTAVYTAGTELTSSGSAFLKGAGLVIQTMLQSPYFIYRSELGTAGQPLNGFDLAAKMSFALLDVGPSDALLDAAQAGQLDTQEGAATQAQQLLSDPNAVTAMRRFHGETLQFKRFENLRKDPAIVPEFTQGMAPAAQEAAYLFFDRIFTQDLGLADIFTSTTGYVNKDLATLYGVAAPTGTNFKEMDLGADRIGYFSQLPYLLMHSVNYVPDPIHRGVDLGIRMLCAQVDTPNFVPPQPPSPEAGQSNREVIEVTTSPELCNSCHGYYINPLGFAFENFDGLGRYRTEDNGSPVNAAGTYPFVEGDKAFNNNKELMNLLTQSEQAHQCYAKNMIQFVLGRELKSDDMPQIESLATLSAGHASTKELLVELVNSPSFRNYGGGTQ